MSRLTEIRKAIHTLGHPDKAASAQRFFKTAVGEYGYGDVFLGLTVPQSRTIAKLFYDLTEEDIVTLLHSAVHEERLIALVLMTMRFKKASAEEKEHLYDLYLANTKYINNWDLVDLSAEYIVGTYLYEGERAASTSSVTPLRHSGLSGISHEGLPIRDSGSRLNLDQNDEAIELVKLAHSKSIWERRIAMIACFAWIKNGEVGPTFTIADILLHDSEDLIQKAVGWMLREVGKRVSDAEERDFLRSRYTEMPRTMLRYAIERFPEVHRKQYLAGEI